MLYRASEFAGYCENGDEPTGFHKKQEIF